MILQVLHTVGNTLFSQAEVRIQENGIMVNKKKEGHFLTFIDTDKRPNDDEIDISHLQDNEHKEKLLE